MHVNINIRCRSRKVDEAQAAVFVHDTCKGVIGCIDACNVRAGREGTYLELPFPVSVKSLLKIGRVNGQVFPGFHEYHICKRLVPGSLV